MRLDEAKSLTQGVRWANADPGKRDKLLVVTCGVCCAGLHAQTCPARNKRDSPIYGGLCLLGGRLTSFVTFNTFSHHASPEVLFSVLSRWKLPALREGGLLSWQCCAHALCAVCMLC